MWNIIETINLSNKTYFSHNFSYTFDSHITLQNYVINFPPFFTCFRNNLCFFLISSVSCLEIIYRYALLLFTSFPICIFLVVCRTARNREREMSESIRLSSILFPRFLSHIPFLLFLSCYLLGTIQLSFIIAGKRTHSSGVREELKYNFMPCLSLFFAPDLIIDNLIIGNVHPDCFLIVSHTWIMRFHRKVDKDPSGNNLITTLEGSSYCYFSDFSFSGGSFYHRSTDAPFLIHL